MNDQTCISLLKDDLTGPRIEIMAPNLVEVKKDNEVLQVNVDGVCRLRVSQCPTIRIDEVKMTDRYKVGFEPGTGCFAVERNPGYTPIVDTKTPFALGVCVALVEDREVADHIVRLLNMFPVDGGKAT